MRGKQVPTILDTALSESFGQVGSSPSLFSISSLLIGTMLVKYIIPEDGDEFAHPNVFNLQTESATLNDVRKVRGSHIYGSILIRLCVGISCSWCIPL